MSKIPRIPVSNLIEPVLLIGSEASRDYIEPPKVEEVGNERGYRETDGRHSERQRQLRAAWRVGSR